MIVLGLNHGEINSSAAIVKDGKLVAGCPEERFNGKKKTRDFPTKATQFCLDTLDIKLKDCDYTAQSWNAGAGWFKYNPLISSTRIRREDYFYSVPDHLHNFTERKHKDWVLMQFPGDDEMPPIYYVNHHRSHAANAFYLSPFKKAAILTADWRGEYETATMGMGEDNDFKIFDSMLLPHSLGLFYATYTELLGYRPDNDEWKVMALSAYDIDFKKEYDIIKNTVTMLDNGFFELDQSYYKGAIVDQPKLYTEKLKNLLGDREGYHGEPVDDWHKKIANAMQKVSEELAVHMLNKLYELTQCENLVLSGGYFMNSVFNGKVSKLSPFKNVYVPYAPTDAGNSIGAALYVAHNIHKQPRDYSYNSSFIGPESSDSEIEAALNRRKISFEKIENPSQKIGQLLAEGNVVAVMNGPTEFGERALGNRSILGDPRQPDMKDKINAIIKYREGYRPFAPVILHEKVMEYFDVEEDFKCDFMEKVVMIKEQFHAALPAVTHVDGSGRVQTVTPEHNEFFYKVIQEFEQITGVPIVLNTSFNTNGVPIALGPDDALNTFYNSGLEHLFMGSYYVSKVNAQKSNNVLMHDALVRE